MKIVKVNKQSIRTILGIVRKRQGKKAIVEDSVRRIIRLVRKNGDRSLFEMTKKFDGVTLAKLRVSKEEIKEAYGKEKRETVSALKDAKTSISRFQASTVRKEAKVKTRPGVTVWREFRPVERVGLYVPGGKAIYPSTVLMLGIPATIAGCKEIVLCVPPDMDGSVPSAVLVAADLCGITNIFKVGGAQAIAAMAYGTESIPKVSKIFGPGNQYVTTAKMLVYGEVDIDMPAGPSEVLIFADETANSSFVASDLLAQLEHSEDAQAILVTLSANFASDVQKELKKQLVSLPRQEIIRKALSNTFLLVFNTGKEAIGFVNEYAPEHLGIMAKNESAILERITNSGSVFLGAYSSGPIGDYASGSNHTLPTSGYAKMFSPLSVESFGKKIEIQKVSKKGLLAIRKTVETLAEREGLTAHRNAIRLRYKKTP